MPNIRESLYQCLENKVVATSTSPKLELFTVDPSCHAYAITVYVVYNNTSFLEINLNSGTVKSGNSDVGYYRIRQAALQSGENHSLYLVPSVQNGNTYYLALTHVTQGSDIFIRKELKFGVYSKLLSSLTSTALADGNKLTDIKYDAYRTNTAYSNGYFVETEDNTYVKTLLPKGTTNNNDRYLGASDNPFDGAYVSTITTKDILNADSEDKLNIGTDNDRIDTIYSDDVKTTNIDALKIDLGTLANGIRTIKLGETITINGDENSPLRYPEYSGFGADGIFEIQQVDDDHIYTRYKKVDGVHKQQIVVPGGLSITGTGDFTNVTISNTLMLIHDDLKAASGVLNSLFIDSTGTVGSQDLTLGQADITNDNSGSTAHSAGTLNFVTALSQNSLGKVQYHYSTVSVRDTYEPNNNEQNFKPINAKAVLAAIEELDVGDISGFGVDKTLKTLVEADGKISATFQDITVKDTHVLVNEKMANPNYPYGDLQTDDTEATIVEALAKRARKVHAHGYIKNNGCIVNSNDAKVSTPDKGFYLLLADLSKENDNPDNGKIKWLASPFDRSKNDYTFLNAKGEWQASGIPALTTAITEHINGRSTTNNNETTITHIAVHGNITDNGTIADDTAIATDFKFILADNNGVLVKSSLKFDGSTSNKYLSQAGTWVDVPTRTSLDAAPTTHYHDDRYVRFDSAVNLISKGDGMTDEAYATALNTAKSTARKNIGAGTVTSVALSSTAGSLSVDTDAITTSGTINVDMPVKIDVGNSDYVATTDNSGGSLSYSSDVSGFQVETPKISLDAYGRVVGYSNFYQTVPGHTATYDYDSSTGTLTITVQ